MTSSPQKICQTISRVVLLDELYVKISNRRVTCKGENN